MGPLWYKEAQYSLLEQSIEKMQKEDIDEQIIKQSMTILDAASGGMTFERYIRTTKESLIEIIWKKGKYISNDMQTFLNFTRKYYKDHPLIKE